MHNKAEKMLNYNLKLKSQLDHADWQNNELQNVPCSSNSKAKQIDLPLSQAAPYCQQADALPLPVCKSKDQTTN